jgi:hypothetical protein
LPGEKKRAKTLKWYLINSEFTYIIKDSMVARAKVRNFTVIMKETPMPGRAPATKRRKFGVRDYVK